MDIEARIANLDKKIQEYIDQGRKIGIFNDKNIERVVSRLERVRISVDNSLSGDARIDSDRDKNILDIKINENNIQQAKNDGKDYFEDEVLFHEFTHAISSLYENTIETGDAYKFKKNFLKESEKEDYVDDFSYIKDYMSEDEKKKFDQYVNNDNLHLAGYGWILLDEFVAQTIAQKMVKSKYEDKSIYPLKAYESELSNPTYRFYSDLADYEVFTPFATKFIESMYGTKDIENFCKDSLDTDFINKVFEQFQKRPDGLEHLYKMLGGMGNIYFADQVKKGHVTDNKLNERDPKHYSVNRDNIYASIKDFMENAQKEVSSANSEKLKENEEVVQEEEKKNSQESDTREEINESEDVSNSVDDKDKEVEKEDEEEIQNQQLMDIAMNNLNKLLKKITEDYVNKDYTRNSENNEEYQKLITAMADIRILEGGVQIPNLDRMMEIRRVDAAVSNLVFAFRDYATDLKMKNETSFSEKRLNYELNHLQEYLKSDIELQDGTKIKVNKEDEINKEDGAKNEEQKNSEENEALQKNGMPKLDIVYSAEKGGYIVNNTGKEYPETVLRSKKEKIAYIKENFTPEEIKFVFGKNLRKSLKKCDLQLITLLSDFDMNYAKQYIESIIKGKGKEKLPYSMVYDMKNIKKNKNLSMFDKIRLRRLVKKNKNVAQIIGEDSQIEIGDIAQPMLEEKSKEEQYRESLVSNIPQEVNEEKQKKDEAKEDVTKENIEDNER